MGAHPSPREGPGGPGASQDGSVSQNRAQLRSFPGGAPPQHVGTRVQEGERQSARGAEGRCTESHSQPRGRTQPHDGRELAARPSGLRIQGPYCGAAIWCRGPEAESGLQRSRRGSSGAQGLRTAPSTWVHPRRQGQTPKHPDLLRNTSGAKSRERSVEGTLGTHTRFQGLFHWEGEGPSWKTAARRKMEMTRVPKHQPFPGWLWASALRMPGAPPGGHSHSSSCAFFKGQVLPGLSTNGQPLPGRLRELRFVARRSWATLTVVREKTG